MRVEIIELLRCPAEHESSPLVTVASRRDGDRLIEAMLGCSVCGAEYALRDGIAFLTDHSDAKQPGVEDASVDPMRVAALLGLGEPGARAVLCGAYGAAAGAIEQATGARCIIVNALQTTALDEMVDQLVVGTSRTIPLANATLNGLAVDIAHVALLADAPRVVRSGGRVIAPAGAPVPPSCKELARDEHEWVAEVEAAVSAPVGLTRSTDNQWGSSGFPVGRLRNGAPRIGGHTVRDAGRGGEVQWPGLLVPEELRERPDANDANGRE